MTTSSSTTDDASGPSLVWVESMGGPLIVVPVSALPSWGGCTGSGLMAGDATDPDDYDRACAVDDLAGVILIDENGMQALGRVLEVGDPSGWPPWNVACGQPDDEVEGDA
ncbi:Imm21 family immunity protein, partial [Streptomyces sp. NPDC005863]|uniref:Imm21 family immunity protein n=1 Tax=unclassified Streptomyces TaxID=2593676 RepID=UPI0033EDE604